MKATKAELRQEITELRHVGRQMANAMFNIAQGHRVTKDDLEIMDQVRRNWDAIRRREAK